MDNNKWEMLHIVNIFAGDADKAGNMSWRGRIERSLFI